MGYKIISDGRPTWEGKLQKKQNFVHSFIYPCHVRIINPLLPRLKEWFYKRTGCSKSHCAKVWAYCSAPGHPFRKISSGMFQKSSSFKEYSTFYEIGVHFFE